MSEEQSANNNFPTTQSLFKLAMQGVHRKPPYLKAPFGATNLTLGLQPMNYRKKSKPLSLRQARSPESGGCQGKATSNRNMGETHG